MRERVAMKPEGEIGLFREESEVSQFLSFRADGEKARKVAFADGVGASLDCNGSSEIAFCRVKPGQVVEKLYDVGVLWPQRLLHNSQRALKQWLGRRQLALASMDDCKTVDRTSDLGMLGPHRFLLDGERPLN